MQNLPPPPPGFRYVEDSPPPPPGFRLVSDRSIMDRLGSGFAAGVDSANEQARQIMGLLRGKPSDQRGLARQAADDRRQTFARGDGQTTAGQIGKVLGDITAGAVASGPAMAIAGPVRAGIATGAVGGLLQPADSAAQAAKQVGTGAAFGAGGGWLGDKAVKTVQGLANAPRRAINQLTDVTPSADPNAITRAVERTMKGSPAAMRRGKALAEATGVDLTPGQMTGGRAATMAENMARQSIFTADKMLKGDMQRARQMVNAVQRTASKITPSRASAEEVATRLQGMTRNMVSDLANRRSEWGRAAYGRIDKAAGGAPIVDTRNTLNAIASIVDEYKGIQGADASKFAQQAESFFAGLPGDGKISASTAVKQLQAWEKAARTGQGLFEGIQDRSAAKVAAGKLAKAIQADLDNVEAVGDETLGSMLREANKGWRLYSQEMDAIEASALGRIVGEDFVDEVGGIAFNKLPPEKVWQRMDSLTPSELGVVKGYVQRTDPELWRQYQKTTLERALAAAQTSAPSAGNRTLPINPGAFVKALEGSSGEKAVNMTKRLEAIYGDTPQWADIRKLMEVGRRMADATGKNFSGTGPYNEAMGAWQRLTSGAGNLVERVAGTAAGPLGLRRVASVASSPVGQRAPLPLANYSGSLPALTLRGLAGPVAGSAAGYVNRPGEPPRR